MVLKLVAGTTLLLAAFAFWIKHKVAAADRERERDLDRFGLRELDQRLRKEVIADGRPLGTDPRLRVVDTMRQLLRELESTPPGKEQAAVVEPKDEVVRLACEELVRMKLMVANGTSTAYAFRRTPHLRPGERPS